MRIDNYSFGKIVIGKKTYTSDLIIYPDRIEDSWWRRKGHLLQTEDIFDILREDPKLIIIGTGYGGMMKVTEDVIKILKSKGIDVIIKRTPEAIEIYNKISKDRKVVACLHLTC